MTSWILYPGDKRVLINVMDALMGRDESKPWRVTMEEYKQNRSMQQNSYYWGVVLPTIQKHVFEHNGLQVSIDDLHDWYRDEFLPKKVVEVRGKVKTFPTSTASLNVKQFSDYLDMIIYHAAEKGIVVPDPEWR